MRAFKRRLLKIFILTIIFGFIIVNVQILRLRERLSKPNDCSSQTVGFSKVKMDSVALASYPGAGNTWLRYLIEQTSGIYTSSIYCDEALLSKFPGECSENSSTVVVKTHAWPNEGKVKYDKVVILIRSPYRCFRSMFNYKMTNDNHTGVADLKTYRTKFANFVKPFLPFWRSFYEEWIYYFKGPKHVIFYDDLKRDLKEVVRKLMEFLDVSYSNQRLECTLHRLEGSFHRKHADLIDILNYLTLDQVTQFEDDMNFIDNKVLELTNVPHRIDRDK